MADTSKEKLTNEAANLLKTIGKNFLEPAACRQLIEKKHVIGLCRQAFDKE